MYGATPASGRNPPILYVGKAKNLKKRLQSYIRGSLAPKTASLMSQVVDIATTVTNNETEALLLEQTLIKQHRPKFNVLLRDDKSYPFLHLSAHTDFPFLMVKRGNQVRSGKLFGPYSNAHAIRSTLHLLQKVFRLRQCTDAFFANRSRPCLQHQIGRCSAPCVDYISAEAYQQDVGMAVASIRGKQHQVADMLQQEMDTAVSNLNYETAAVMRDRLIALRQVQEQQNVSQQEGHADVLVVHMQMSQACIHHMQVRLGKVVASQSFFPRLGIETTEEIILEQFISQHYLLGVFRPDFPRQIILSHKPAEIETLAAALKEQQGYNVQLLYNVRTDRAQWLQLAMKNAKQAIADRMTSSRMHHGRMLALTECLHLAQMPNRLECFDISHTFGEATVASCVVFDSEGPAKSNYRLFTINTTDKGDDYAAMREVLTRRFSKSKLEQLPDVLFVDGGKGQMGMALKVLAALPLDLLVVGVAKGEGRKPGLETLYVHQPGAEHLAEVHLRPDAPALHLIQHIRDESHRFAIQHHRKKRAKARKSSTLENIEGIGPTRRRTLLRHFGSIKGVHGASVADLERVPGISKALAKQLYNTLHPS